MNNNSNSDLIMQISNEVIRCTSCELCHTRRNAVLWRRIRISKDHVRRGRLLVDLRTFRASPL